MNCRWVPSITGGSFNSGWEAKDEVELKAMGDAPIDSVKKEDARFRAWKKDGVPGDVESVDGDLLTLSTEIVRATGRVGVRARGGVCALTAGDRGRGATAGTFPSFSMMRSTSFSSCLLSFIFLIPISNICENLWDLVPNQEIEINTCFLSRAISAGPSISCLFMIRMESFETPRLFILWTKGHIKSRSRNKHTTRIRHPWSNHISFLSNTAPVLVWRMEVLTKCEESLRIKSHQKHQIFNEENAKRNTNG